MIAIHNSKFGFHIRWIAYCEKEDIKYKLVNCYANDLIEQLKDCEALMWHFNQGNHKDNLIAKQILFALEHTGFKVFPNFRTAWHFDDKVAQKYLFEKIGVPSVPTYVFFNKQEAIDWAKRSIFPKVFKLRGGAGSQNVQLIKTREHALNTIHKAFGRGFPKYDAWGNLKERWRKFRIGTVTIKEVLKGIVRIFWSPKYDRLGAKEVGYVYFQDFIPNNDSDIRIIVIDFKAFALKRYVRKNDFRASGSGAFCHDRSAFDERCIRLALNITQKLNAQCLAYDFVFDETNAPLLIEISYGFSPHGYDDCPGYWNETLEWSEGKFDPYGWMVESILKKF